jgi:hypothetical protein
MSITAKEADGTSRTSQIYFNARRSHQDIAISGNSHNDVDHTMIIRT